MVKECAMITISEKEYPIRFDYMVLKEISERYTSIEKFEMDLLGLEKMGKDEDGNDLFGKTKDPSISCILFVLPLMINSALDYLGKDLVEESQIIKEVDIHFITLSSILHQEMQKCFKTGVVVKKKFKTIPNR